MVMFGNYLKGCYHENMNELSRLNKNFEDIKHIDAAGEEFWSARELMPALGYAKWENFLKVLHKACRSAATARHQEYYNINDWLPEVRKPITTGKGRKDELVDYHLSRYMCYLVAQNGSSSKPEIAQAQSYFAAQTRRQELNDLNARDLARLEARHKYSESDKKLSTIVKDREVSRQQLAAIKSNGDKVLFGGCTTKEMKARLGLKDKKQKPLADVLPTISLTAKQLANEMTYMNTERNNLIGFQPIDSEHRTNNQTICDSLADRGIKLEELPAEPDIKLLQQKLKSNQRLARGKKQLAE